MSSPFLILEKFPPTLSVMEKQYGKRASQIFKKISPYINKKDKILDIGSGTGFVARKIEQTKCKNITCVDVKINPMCKLLPVTLYNGKRLPFEANSFNTALLIAVLHHCKSPEKILDEAIRVSSKRIIILEDLFESRIEKILTFVEDSIVNWEFRGHPHSNMNEGEWLNLFKKKKLNVTNFEKFHLVCAGFPFRLGIFILDKNNNHAKSKSPKRL